MTEAELTRSCVCVCHGSGPCVSVCAKGQGSLGHVACCCAKETMFWTRIWDDGASPSQFVTHIWKGKRARVQTSGAAAWEEGVWCKQHVSSIKIAPNNSHLVVYDNYWLAAKPNLSNFANPSRQQLYGNSVCVCVRARACVCLVCRACAATFDVLFFIILCHTWICCWCEAKADDWGFSMCFFCNKFPPTLDFFWID